MAAGGVEIRSMSRGGVGIVVWAITDVEWRNEGILATDGTAIGSEAEPQARRDYTDKKRFDRNPPRTRARLRVEGRHIAHKHLTQQGITATFSRTLQNSRGRCLRIWAGLFVDWTCSYFSQYCCVQPPRSRPKSAAQRRAGVLQRPARQHAPAPGAASNAALRGSSTRPCDTRIP